MKRLLLLLVCTVGMVSMVQAQTYCPATHSNGCAVGNIPNSMVVPNTTFNVTFPRACTNGTVPYTRLGNVAGQILDVVEGNTYTLEYAAASGGLTVSLWIDWDKDSTFSVGEWIDVTRSLTANSTVSVAFTVPSGITGRTKARLRNRLTGNPNLATDACLSFASGHSFDFDVEISASTPCAGTPATPVLANFPTAPLCLGDSVVVSNGTQIIGGGITRLWEYSTNSGSSWQPVIGNSTSNSFLLRARSYPAGSIFRFTATCANGGQSSSVISGPISFKPINECYCVPTNTGTCTVGHLLTALGSGGGWAPTIPTACNAASYEDMRAGDTLRLSQGVITSLTGATGATNISVSLWIDYNKNGVYEANEWLDVKRQTATGIQQFSVDVVAPYSSLGGVTYGRIRTRNSNVNNAGDACTAFSGGFAYDFPVRITPAAPCATVAAATISSTAAALCSAESATLTATNVSTGFSGYSYLWQRSTDGGSTWNPVGGNDSASTISVTGASLNGVANQFRFVTTCRVNGQVATSTTVSIGVANAAQCYCIPAHTVCTVNEILRSIAVTAVNFRPVMPTTCLPNAGAQSFFLLSGSAPTDTLTITQGVPFDLEIQTGTNTLNMNAGLWVDYDQDGAFAPNSYEYKDLGRNIPTNATTTVTVNNVPTFLAFGVTRARLRTRQTGNTNDSTTACATNYASGHTYDFWVRVLANPLSLDKQVSQILSLYPNPANNTATVTLPEGARNVSFNLVDLTGRTLKALESTVNGNQHSLDLKAVPAGVYQLVVTTAQGRSAHRLVVQH